MQAPSYRASSGIRSGPTTISALIRMTMSSAAPIPNMIVSLHYPGHRMLDPLTLVTEVGRCGKGSLLVTHRFAEFADTVTKGGTDARQATGAEEDDNDQEND